MSRKPKEASEVIKTVNTKSDTGNNPKVDESTIKRYTEFYKKKLLEHGYDNREPFNTNAVARYFANYFYGSTKKGLCLIGDTGRGKTFAFRIMKRLLATRIFEAETLVDRWQIYGPHNRKEIYKELTGHYPHHERLEIARNWRDCIIDDIGTEPILNEFGTKREVIDSIIQRRTREFEEFGARTHISTNLSLNQLQERYGKRFVSRLNQICHIVVLKGEDRREDKS
jgi:DNA replication protein DnaC